MFNYFQKKRKRTEMVYFCIVYSILCFAAQYCKDIIFVILMCGIVISHKTVWSEITGVKIGIRPTLNRHHNIYYYYRRCKIF